jgi:HAD superfamily hydrolase (TIGR01509 family)
MKLKALIFDVDGTIASTERNGHLPACNEAFQTMGYPIRWSWDEFKAMQHIEGNALRMRASLMEWKPEWTESEVSGVVDQLIALKKKLYVEKYLPKLPLRDGVAEIMEEALNRAVKLAVVSMSYEVQVRALLQHHLPQTFPHFHPILGRESGPKVAPDSPLYTRCIDVLGTGRDQTLVIEDSEEGFEAAKRAGLRCAVMYNDYTFGKNFAGAQLVARSLYHFTLDQLDALCMPHGEGAA